IPHEDEAEVALARLVDGRARAVRKVAAAEDERGDAERTQMRFERRLVEGSPARLVDEHLARPDVLDAAGQEKLRLESGRAGGEEAGTSKGWPSRVSCCVSIVTSATEAKSGARYGSVTPLAAPERDRLGEVAALVGGLVGIQVRVVRLQEAAPAGHELARRALVR